MVEKKLRLKYVLLVNFVHALPSQMYYNKNFVAVRVVVKSFLFTHRYSERQFWADLMVVVINKTPSCQF